MRDDMRITSPRTIGPCPVCARPVIAMGEEAITVSDAWGPGESPDLVAPHEVTMSWTSIVEPCGHELTSKQASELVQRYQRGRART